MKKKLIIIIICVCFLCLLVSLAALDSAKYICRVPSSNDTFEELPNSKERTPFIADSERDRLLERAIHRELKSFSDPITYEIKNWDMVLHEGKETLFYILRVVDADGFVSIISVIITPRW